ncbi:MAG TPA: hypothetical protein VKW09_15650 [bacterium]|nr:hypothetical protein [bacterium]
MRIVVGILVALALVAAISGAYHAGVVQGVAQSGHMPAAPGAPYPMYPYGYYGYGWHGPFGFGFFGFLWPLLWIVLLVFLFRGLFFRGRRYWGGGPWSGGAPRWLEEWHRREHESKGQAGTA